ncbi:MAG: hypothetical protein KC503_46145 [Myxococcales bacterium]|nr:hypothetical protein [Myxococcales bacterium]
MSTFKVKIGVVALIIIGGLTVAMLMLAVSPLSTQGMHKATSAVRRASKLVERSQRLYAYDLVARAKALAAKKAWADGIRQEDEKQRRAAIFDAINQIDKKLKDKNLKPGFLGCVDKKGVIIARDLDPNADHGEQLKYDTVTAVLSSGRARSAVWLMKNRMLRAAVAPVIDAGNIVGAVVLAYDFTVAEARQDQSQFGAHVAYILDGNIRATSFTEANDPNTEDASKVSAVASAIMAKAKQAIAAGKISDVLDITINGEAYKAITGPLPAPISIVTQTLPGKAAGKEKTAVGFVVLSSLDKALAPAGRARLVVLVFGVIVLLLVFGCMWGVERHFVNAQDHLELGINEVINGNMEYIFDARQEFEGMANALNVMLARLLGRPEPGEDEEGDAAWRADVIVVDAMEGASDPGLAQSLAGEAEDQYFARLFSEYVEARKQANLPTEGISLENLTQKLRANEAMLKAKHKCRMVRFVVSSAGGKVSFKPVRID